MLSVLFGLWCDAVASPPTSPEPTAIGHTLESRFYREDGDLRSVSLQLRLSIQVTPEPVWAQLDTGIGPAMRLEERGLQGRIEPQRGVPPVHPNLVEIEVGAQLSGLLVAPTPIPVALKAGAVGGRVGSVGASSFHGHVLVLNLSEDSAVVYDRLPAELVGGCAAEMWLGPEGRPWVRVDGRGPVLVDTGSAPHGLWVGATDFADLTGHAVGEEGEQIIAGQAFGKPITIHHRPSAAALTVGQIPLPSARITHVPQRPLAKDGRFGILGLHAFQGSSVALDFAEGRLVQLGGTCTRADLNR